MKSSMYNNCVPVLELAIGNLKTMLEKGAAYGEQHQLDESVVLNTRLYPDMLPMKSQVFIATDIAKGAIARLAGTDPIVFEDNENSYAELFDRCDKTIDYISTASPEDIDGSEEKAIVVKTPRIELNFNGHDYLAKFVIPNVHFHSSMAYAILRNIGAPLGKQDYLGPIL